MAYDVELADRIRDVLETTDDLDVVGEVVEKKMFGGLGFLVGGHMAVAAGSRGDLMMRVDPAAVPALLAEPHVGPMVMSGKSAERLAAGRARGLRRARRPPALGGHRRRAGPPAAAQVATRRVS